jgi:hypothetical protein
MSIYKLYSITVKSYFIYNLQYPLRHLYYVYVHDMQGSLGRCIFYVSVYKEFKTFIECGRNLLHTGIRLYECILPTTIRKYTFYRQGLSDGTTVQLPILFCNHRALTISIQIQGCLVGHHLQYLF